MRRLSEPLDGISTHLILVAASLMTIGIVMVASTSANLDHTLFDMDRGAGPVLRQASHVGVGLVVMLICGRVGPQMFRWRSGSWAQPSVMLLLATVVLLACVWVPGLGVESHGRRRWLAMGPIGFQPSEVAKLAIVIFLAAVLSRKRSGSERDKPDLTIAVLVIGVVCALVGKEDFGTAVLIAAVGAAMLLVRGCPWTTMAAWTLPTVGAFGYLLMSHPYRVKRLLSFMTIWDDPRGAGYHPIQSLAAIASGGWTGTGLGAGMAKYGYLPESRTDFIFAIICEETGLLGGFAVIALYVAFVVLGMRAMARAPSLDGGFGRMFAFGVTFLVASQALMNIAVVTVVAPTKGISLPLVSAGGSGVICFCVAIGLLAGVPRLRVIDPAMNPETTPMLSGVTA